MELWHPSIRQSVDATESQEVLCGRAYRGRRVVDSTRAAALGTVFERAWPIVDTPRVERPAGAIDEADQRLDKARVSRPEMTHCGTAFVEKR